jgi:hypothetical protein
MPIGLTAGTTISISASAPARYDVYGYDALTFTPIGNVESGGDHGRSYSEFSFETIGSDGIRKYKDKYVEGDKVLEIAYDSKDPGINLLKQALTSKSDYSFAVKYPTGDIDYFRAKLIRLNKSIGTVNSINKVTAALSITTQGEIGIIEYLYSVLQLESGFYILQENESRILLG